MSSRAPLLFSVLLLACVAELGDGGLSDAGDAQGDAGAPQPTDAGRDASVAPDDAGRPEPGEPDAGELDAGPVDPGPPDAGPVDPGEPDPGPPDSGPPPVTGPWIIHVAANGNDSRDGSTPARAVRTLTRVHALIADARPNRDVEVRIAPGTYRGQQVRWTYTMPDHSIRFVTAAADRTRPIFDGCLANGQCPGGTWFILSSSSGRPTNLAFEYIRVTRYQTAISLNGSRNSRSTSNGSNRIYGCYFDRIGNVFASALDPSTAAVRLVNSDDNEIANNHFVDVINTRSGALIHGIYAAHGSERNRIERNRFLRSTGDPVRIRDYSNDNIIRHNRFIRVGTAAGYTEWYCDHAARSDCTSPNPECPSWGNQFRDNTLDGTWTCGRLGVWELFQGDSTRGCSRPSSDARRVRTSDNTHTATPCSME